MAKAGSTDLRDQDYDLVWVDNDLVWVDNVQY